jgi:lipoprotein-anchoring transpeptidase ErfK/SrfK
MKILARLVVAALLLSGAACTTVSHRRPAPAPSTLPVPAKASYWHGDSAKGAPSIRIVISQQRAYFYKDSTIVGQSTISTGKKGYETPPGHYKVIQKDKNHVSNLYGEYVDDDGNVIQSNVDVSKDPCPYDGTFVGAKMPFFLRFTGGYGMHAGHLPGYRASHGCVRMPSTMAEHFFNAAGIGTPVTVDP